MPNQPKTPARAIRISDAVWDAAKAKADQKGDTMTGIIRAFLERYGKQGATR